MDCGFGRSPEFEPRARETGAVMGERHVAIGDSGGLPAHLNPESNKPEA